MAKKVILVFVSIDMAIGLLMIVIGGAKADWIDAPSSQNFLPKIINQVPCDFGGQATVGGQPIANLPVSLYRYTFEGGHSIVMTSSTNIDGEYCFTNVSLLYCRGFWYGVTIGPNEPESGLLHSWSSGYLVRCEPEDRHPAVNASLEPFEIESPVENITLTLPITFSWSRPVTHTDYDLLWNFPNCGWKNVYSGPVTQAVISTVDPACLTSGVPITWYVRGFSPNNGNPPRTSIANSQFHIIYIDLATNLRSDRHLRMLNLAPTPLVSSAWHLTDYSQR